MSDDAVVKNAGDEGQVKKATERQEYLEDREIKDIQEVLSVASGRRLLWRIMEWTGCEGTPKRSTDELTYMAIGSGDVGRWLKSEIVKSGEDLLFTMMKENMEKPGGKDGRRK